MRSSLILIVLCLLHIIPIYAQTETEVSVIQIKSEVKTKTLSRIAFAEATKKPILDWSSPELRAKLLAIEKVTVKEYVKAWIDIPGHYVNQPKRVWKVVRRIPYKRFLNPYKFITEYKDVFGWAEEMVKVWIPPTKELRTVLTPVTKLVDKVIPTTVWIKAKANLTSLDFKVNNNIITAVAFIDYRISADVKNKLLGSSMKIKGALSSKSQLKLTLVSSVDINNEAKVVITRKDFKYKWTKIGLLDALTGINLLHELGPTVIIVKKILDKQIDKQVDKQLNKQSEKLAFRDKINKSVREITGPHKIAKDVWFVPNIKEVFVSPLHGSGAGNENTIFLSAGIIAKPKVIVSEVAPLVENKSPKFSIGSYGNTFHVILDGQISFREAEAKLLKALQSVKEINDVKISSQNGQIIVDISIFKPIQTVLRITATPKYQDKYVSIINPKASVENGFEDLIKLSLENMRWKIGDDFEKKLDAWRNFRTETKQGALQSHIASIQSRLSITEEAFHIFIDTKGTLTFEPKFK